MFQDKYVSNRDIYKKLVQYINRYDYLFPPVGELPTPPTMNQAEAYIVSKWMLNEIRPYREHFINPQMFFLHCRQELRYIQQKNIKLLMDFLLDT